MRYHPFFLSFVFFFATSCLLPLAGQVIAVDTNQIRKTLDDADLAWEQGDYKSFLEMSSDIVRKLENGGAARSPLYADAAIALGRARTFYEMPPDSVFPYLEKAAEFWKAFTSDEHIHYARALHWLGVANNAYNYWADADSILQRSLSIRKKYYRENHKLFGDSYAQLGITAYGKGHYAEALQLFLRSARNYREVLDSNHHLIALNKFFLGSIYGLLEMPDSALIYIDQSIESYQRIRGEGHVNLAPVVLEKGNYYFRRGNYNDAIENYRRAEQLYVNFFGEEPRQLCTIYNNLGACTNALRQPDKASEYYRKALNLAYRKRKADDPLVSLLLSNIAGVYLSINQLDSALLYLQEGLMIRRKKLRAKHPDIAQNYRGLARVYHKLGQSDTALILLDSALEISLAAYRADHSEVADCYLELAGIYSVTGKFQRSEAYYQKAMDILLPVYGEEHEETGRLYFNRGVNFQNAGLYQQAKENLTKGLDIWQKTISPFHPDMLLANQTMAEFSITEGNFKEAIRYYGYVKNMIALSKGVNDAAMGLIRLGLGKAYYLSGDFVNGLEELQLAKTILTDSYGEESREMAQVYMVLGSYYEQLGDHQKGVDYYQRALKIKTAWPEVAPIEIGPVYQGLAISYMSLNEMDKALEFNNKALAIYEMIYDSTAFPLAALYNNFGAVYTIEKEYEKATAYYEKALAIMAKNIPNTTQYASTIQNVGWGYLQFEQFEKATYLVRQSLKLRKELLQPDHPHIATSWMVLGIIEQKKGDFEKGVALMDSALQVVQFSEKLSENNRYNSLWIFSFLNFRADILQDWYKHTGDLQHLRKAMQDYRTAQKVIGVHFQYLRREMSRVNLMRKVRDVYDGAIEACYRMYQATDSLAYLENAFYFSEQSRAFVLYQAMQESKALKYTGIPDSVVQNESDLRQRITLLQKSIFNESQKSENRSGLETQLFALENEFEQLKLVLEKKYQSYYQLKYSFSPPDLKTVQKKILTPEQSLVEYFIHDTTLFILVVNPDQVVLKREKHDFPLQEWVKQLREGLTAYHTQKVPPDYLFSQMSKQYTDAAWQLYQKLIAPIEEYLKPELLIVPDGVLAYLPFETLLKEKPQKSTRFASHDYLLRRYAVSYSYSATLSQEMSGQKTRRKKRQPYLGFAPFADEGTEVLVADRSLHLPKLPYSGEEVKSIQNLLGGRTVMASEATREKFLELMDEYQILHFATHGQANDETGEFSFLAFAEGDHAKSDGLLFVRELYNARVNAELVSLSACETGIGQLRQGEGIISLARAFSYAGAGSIVTTIWKVKDQFSRQFMPLFYQDLKKGLSKNEALRNVKIQYINAGGDMAHPYYWSGFICIGDTSPLNLTR